MANIGSSSGTPRKEWYVRTGPNDEELFGPVSFYEADKHARYLSSLEDGQKTAQVIRIMSTAAGDPARRSNSVFVAYAYVDGKKFVGGRVAQFLNGQGLPPFG